MRFQTSLILGLSRSPGSPDYRMNGVHYQLPTALERLEAVFPDFRQAVAGMRILDFGCGFGYQSVALALAGASQVIGVDINPDFLNAARQLAQAHAVEDRILWCEQIPSDTKADIVILLNSFEHFSEPEKILVDMRNVLQPGGSMYLTFSPPWYAPTGAHMYFFCRVPWLQLLFSESAVMEARSFFRNDAAKRYEDCGLNKMSVAKFERILGNCGLEMSYRRYDCIRRLDLLGRIPWLRELAINRVSCILRPVKVGA